MAVSSATTGCDRPGANVPDTTIILNHVGGILGVGPYAGRREEIFANWRKDIAELAKCPNVNMKLGGLGMVSVGFDFHERDVPPPSEDLAAAWRPYIETCIEAFGPNRCMFESNFPRTSSPAAIPSCGMHSSASLKCLGRGEGRAI